MNGLRGFPGLSLGRVAAAALLLLPLGLANRFIPHALGASGPRPHTAMTSCQLTGAGNTIQHVIYIQFDNTHFRRDNPNVPSDLEQMPHLLSFIKDNGTLLTNHHTPLISHTSEDILTSLTGVYPDRHGVAVGQNSYQFYKGGSPRSYTTAFTYWTDTIGNGTYNMLSGAPSTSSMSGTNAPAPWVPYTRAGCDVGTFATANMALENTNVNSKYGANDIAATFGANSPEATEALSNSNQAFADFVGVAVHCSQADSADGKLCGSANHGRPDRLPNEPNPDGSAATTDLSGTSTAYEGYNALYGNKYVAPQITADGGVTVSDTAGNPITNTDTGTAGFPGFDPTAAQSLGYVAAMQEHGIPVTFAYIADVHDQNPEPAQGHTALGPGEQTYVQQLKAYDDAFAAFFARLQKDGIDKSNTLFVFSTDEGDHFTGAAPNNPDCTGATIDNTQDPPVVTPGNYCTYTKTPYNPTTPPGPPFGEVTVGLEGVLAAEQNVTSPQFTVGNDTAPGVYLNGTDKAPTPTDPAVRAFERATGALTVTNPLSNKVEKLAQYLADPTELNLLHMVTADASRTPTFVLFARPDYYVTATCDGGYNSTTPVTPSICVLEKPAYAWLHGNIQPDITRIWLGLVGPGVQNNRVDNSTWSDHTDIRPTMLALTGLRDDYSHDGRVLLEDLAPGAVPALQGSRDDYIRLAHVYKQINAPVGALALASLHISTVALRSGSSSDDSVYTNLEGQLASITAQRDDLAAQMEQLLDAATGPAGHESAGAPMASGASDGGRVQNLVDKGNALLGSVIVLAENSGTSGSTGGTTGGATATATQTAAATQTATASPTQTATASASATGTSTVAATATSTGTVAASPTATTTGTTGGQRVPRYKHIFYIMMENHSYNQIIGNSNAPIINGYASKYGLATHYYGVTHPSEPNYVASIGGNFFGIQDDAPYYTTTGSVTGTLVYHTVAYPSLADQLEHVGLSWKTYQQSLPYVGYLGTRWPQSGPTLYASKHNPFLNFASVQSNANELKKIVPWDGQAGLFHDLSHGGVPNVSYIVPDQCNDMHGTTGCSDDTALIKQGDQTVGALVDAIRASHAWKSGNNAIVITWDENDFAQDTPNGCCDADGSSPADGGGGGHVATIVITNHGPRGLKDDTPYNHYSLLRTIQLAFGLGCLQYTCDIAHVTPMAPLFATNGDQQGVSGLTRF